MKGVFRTSDAVTLLAAGLVLTGVPTMMVGGLAWFGWCLYVFIRDYEDCQTQLRRLARRDDAL